MGAVRRHGRALAAGAAALLVVVLALVAYAAWSNSSRVLVPEHPGWREDVAVEGVAPGRVTLARDEDTERPGLFALVWQGGGARVGEILALEEETVTRALRALDGYLVPGMEVAITPDVYRGDPRRALGLPSRDVEVRGELGPMPAWLVPAPGSTWAIVVHGINGDPQAGLRIAPALHAAGLPTLLITYRDDLGAPASPDGLHHMGLTEWRDVEAAVRFAIRRGARRVVLAGYSMGGSLVAQFMRRSPLAPRVAGLVLDAPALDWREIFAFNAAEMGMPRLAALPLEWAIGLRIEVDWPSLDVPADPVGMEFPILLFHGGEDDVVPISISEDLAAALPRHVEFHEVARAGHTEAWNVDRRLYERRLRAFLARIGAAGPRSGDRPSGDDGSGGGD